MRQSVRPVCAALTIRQLHTVCVYSASVGGELSIDASDNGKKSPFQDTVRQFNLYFFCCWQKRQGSSGRAAEQAERERERERAELKGTFLASAEHTAEQINDDDYTQAKL